MLTWYDTDARNYFGGDPAAQAELTATVNETNAAYDRSGVNQSLRSVGIEFADNPGHDGLADHELGHLQTTADGFLDAVHARRDALGADLVSLITPLSDACGIGYLGGPASGVNGFTIVAPSCARSNLSFAHELGHNMGGGHGTPDGGGLFSYSNGYRDIVNGFRTVMSYNSASCPGGFCQRIAYFSGPTVLYNGHALGSATEDNTRTLNERAAITAAYRAAPTGVSGTVTDIAANAPVAGMWIAALRTSDFSVAGGAATNANGDYFAPLSAGTYYLYMIDPTGTRFSSFYGAPNTITVTSGNIVDVDPIVGSTRGSVTGTITEDGTGTPIAGAWAIGLNAATGAPETAVVANGSGQFTLPGLAAWNHLMVYADPTGAHASEFYANSSDAAHANPVAVNAGGSTVANDSMATQTGTPGGSTLTGTVTETATNVPLGGVAVMALRATDFRLARAAFTNASGQYSLNVQAGNYKLVFLDSAGRHDTEWHFNQPYYLIANAASVTAPAVTNAVLDSNNGAMAGTITDDPAGTPIAGAWVIAIGPSGIAGGATTAADGTYTIPGLPGGTYRAAFIDPTGTRTLEYYNNSPGYAGATTFNITFGNTTNVSAGLALQPPPNDAFANAQVITGASGTVSGVNANATKEPGEPNHGGFAGGRSVWYRWTAPGTGTVTINTCGSDFDTLLAGYIGTSVNSLSLMNGNDDGCGAQSQISFFATFGVQYRIAVDGFGGTNGNIVLNWSWVNA